MKKIGIWGKIKQELLYMGLDKVKYQNAQAQIAVDKQKAIVSYSIWASIFWIICLIMSFYSEPYLKCRSIYVFALIGCNISLICTAFVSKYNSKLLFIVSHLFKAVIIGAGIGIAIFQPTDKTVTMIAFAIMISTCVIENIATNIATHVAGITVYMILGRPFIEHDIYMWGLVNLIIFSVAGIIIGAGINKSRVERYIYAESANELAEAQRHFAYYDQLTGLKNRRAYDEELRYIQDNYSGSYCIIMSDVNGLKKINDNLGHEAGDELITGTARCLSEAFNGIDTIYRIGGDEFCVIVFDTEEEVCKRIKFLEKNTADYLGKNIKGISVSYGVASNKNLSDTKDILAQADHNMYEFKRNYYKNSGIDRRK